MGATGPGQVETMARSVGLSLEKIPRTPTLLLDYLYHPEKVQPFFPGPLSLERPLPTKIGPPPRFSGHRSLLVAALRRQNQLWGAGAQTFENLDRLSKDHCLAVVTGQQVGLFTGPVYTIYKALTAVKLAGLYRHRGIDAVPVFWMASEDHDIDEVNRTQIVAADSTLRSVQFAARSGDDQRSVGPITFPHSIEDFLGHFLEALPNSEFKSVLSARLKQAYRGGNSYARAFAEIVCFLFSEYGLILLDPQDSAFKEMAKPAFLKIASAWPELDRLLRSRNERLAHAGYPPQVSTEAGASFLFLEEEGKRRGLVGTRDGFSLKGTSRVLAELQTVISQAPEKISPNVLFRPIVQDFLLPTLAYVAGPSEVAYYAQLSPLYQTLGREMPAIVPRASITVIEKRMEKLLVKYRLGFCDLFQGSQPLLRHIIESAVNQELSSKFDRLESDISSRLSRMEGPLKSVDPTLVGSLGTARKKIQYQLGNLRAKFVGAESRQREILTRQVESVSAMLFPLKGLQERQINVFYFLSRYGPDFLAQLYDAIDLSSPDHQLLYLSELADVD